MRVGLGIVKKSTNFIRVDGWCVRRELGPWTWGQPWGQPFTYDLFDASIPSEFEHPGSWFPESPLGMRIPKNLFPSISARHEVADGTGELNPTRS